MSSTQVASFAIASDHLDNYPTSNTNTYTAPSCGIAYKKLKWNYTALYQCMMSIYVLSCLASSMTLNVHFNYGSTLV